MSAYIISQHLQLVLMDAPSSIDADPDQHNARLVHRQTDGVRGAVACVPAATLACFGEAVWRCFHRVERVQSINLIKEAHTKTCIQQFEFIKKLVTMVIARQNRFI